MKRFDYSLDYKNLNLRESPELYSIGRGEQGVLTVEPYKSEILPHWRFKTADIAAASSEKIYALFLGYLRQQDFVGADMARKFLQMGFTRARRYANYKGGKKYVGPVPDEKKGQSGSHGRPLAERATGDPEKALAAEIFKEKWDRAKSHDGYLQLKEIFIDKYG